VINIQVAGWQAGWLAGKGGQQSAHRDANLQQHVHVHPQGCQGCASRACYAGRGVVVLQQWCSSNSTPCERCFNSTRSTPAPA
jgi:hypothetical protein